MRCWCAYPSEVRCRLFAYGPADATVSLKSHQLFSRLNPDWFYLSDTGLIYRVVLEKRSLNGCSVAAAAAAVVVPILLLLGRIIWQDATHCYRLWVCVCLLVTTGSPIKTDEPIEVLFRPKGIGHVLGGARITHVKSTLGGTYFGMLPWNK